MKQVMSKRERDKRFMKRTQNNVQDVINRIMDMDIDNKDKNYIITEILKLDDLMVSMFKTYDGLPNRQLKCPYPKSRELS